MLALEVWQYLATLVNLIYSTLSSMFCLESIITVKLDGGCFPLLTERLTDNRTNGVNLKQS